MDLDVAEGEKDLVESSGSDSNSNSNMSSRAIEFRNEENVVNRNRNENVPGKSKTDDIQSEMSYELQQGYRILNEIMSDNNKGINQIFMNSVEHYNKLIDPNDYYQVVKKPIWLRKIKEKFCLRRFKSITDFVGDMRLMLENYYRYYGPDHSITKKGVKLEMVMEQKLALLPKDLRDKTTLEMTGNLREEEFGGARRKSMRLGRGDVSLLLHQVRNEKSLRDKELRKRSMEERKVEKEAKEKVILEWEESLLQEPLKTHMKASWELPQIGHFLYLCQIPLNTPEVPQFELERMLAMPRESGLLARIMTALLSSPKQRLQLARRPPMPYRVWTEKLKVKVQGWYKYYAARGSNAQDVFEHLGIEPPFFEILGSTNLLDSKPFHELTFHQRIWLLKSVCDYILHNHKTIQDIISDQPYHEQQAYLLGVDEDGNRYLHFPQFCGQDLRIYRQAKWVPPKLDIPQRVVKTERENKLRRKQMQKLRLKKRRECAASKVKSTNSVASTTPSRPSRLRQNIKPVVKLIINNSRDQDDHEDASELEMNEESEDSGQDDEAEEVPDEGVVTVGEPDILKFELVVDSVESLRKFCETFEGRKSNSRRSKEQKNGKITRKNGDDGLYEHLCNLLTELEPWETKLQHATRRLRNKLHKEWHDYRARYGDEDESEDTWSSSEENAENEEEKVEVRSDESSNGSTNSSCYKKVERSTPVRRKKRKFVELSGDGEDDDDDGSDDGSSRNQSVKDNGSSNCKYKKDETNKIANGAAKGLLLSHSQQNTASQAKQLYAWETLRQILVSPQKENESVGGSSVTSSDGKTTQDAYHDTIRNLLTTKRKTSESTNDVPPKEVRVEDRPSVHSLDPCLPQPSIVSKRQSTLSIQLPSVKFIADGFSPAPQTPFIPTTPLPKTPAPTTNSVQQVLTPAPNSGTPKFLANMAGPNAQFMHFQLGNPQSKKSTTPPVKIVNGLTPQTPPSVNPVVTPTKIPQQQQKVLLVPAVDQRGNTVYLKVVAHSDKDVPKKTSPPTTVSSPLPKPPPLAPISKSKPQGIGAAARQVRVLSQPPPLAQIARVGTGTGSKSAGAVPQNFTFQRTNHVIRPGVKMAASNTQVTNSSSTGEGRGRLVMLQTGQTQSLGMILENGHVVPVNVATSTNSTVLAPAVQNSRLVSFTGTKSS